MKYRGKGRIVAVKAWRIEGPGFEHFRGSRKQARMILQRLKAADAALAAAPKRATPPEPAPPEEVIRRMLGAAE